MFARDDADFGKLSTHALSLAPLPALCIAISVAFVISAFRSPTSAQAPGKPDVQASLPISCSADAQREFNRGATLLHHMTYPRAREAFEYVARIDSDCAMAHWGIAMTLFQPLWPTRPTPNELRRGWEAVEIARSLNAPTERERSMIEAVGAFFADPESTDYWPRIRRWERAMAHLHAAFPRDLEIAAFYALAHLAAAPQDSVPGYSERAATILLKVYAASPGHPGAMHYLVHANDAPGRERSSLEVTREYASSAPRNPHALHMPTHIHTRLGHWPAVIRGNQMAAAAALEHPAGDQGQFIWDEFPHAIEYLVYAFLQQAHDDSAAAEMRRLHETKPLQPTFKTAFHLASTQARYALERRDWAEAARLRVREPADLDWDRFTWPEAILWYARGLGAVHENRLEDVRSSEARLTHLEEMAKQAGEVLFAANIRVLRLQVNAWRAHRDGDSTSSIAVMKEAAEIEKVTPKHAVTPAPTLPALELLGDMLMEQSRPADALASYLEALDLYPQRFNSLLGAARAAAALQDDRLASRFYKQLLLNAGNGTRKAVLEEARSFVRRDLPPDEIVERHRSARGSRPTIG